MHTAGYNQRAHENGFTLIEMVISLVLIAIFTSVAGMGLVQIVEGYALARQNSQTAQKAQIAMTRIVRELSGVQSLAACPTCGISSAMPNSVTYTRWQAFNNSTAITNTIQLSGNTLQIIQGSAATLIDNVTTFNLGYYDAGGNQNPSVANIRRIDIALTVSGADNQVFTLNSSVNPMESDW